MAYGSLTKDVERSKLADAVGAFGKFSTPTSSFAVKFLNWAHEQKFSALKTGSALAVPGHHMG